ncbi:MAG: site-specific DNA-methyltransferase [Armatimonadetes bacterium]|nr:site-specific DNA-methyltransferase [Armatimonadota bacterium]NIO97820.1 site-specific DNA-methyltransferase [Armatimonadota bacterium]
MTEARTKLQSLLRELFEFDCADLDFGVYRIMNHKRAEIERFIEKELLDAVARELNQGVLSSQAQAASQLAEAAQEVRSTLGAESISPEGDLSEQYHKTPLGKHYLELREQAATYQARPEQETLIFNHLFEFFRRYYQDGDFISKRRYSRRERYAIPYNGEEVYLYWANKDQYYVKSGEYFTGYTFKAPGGVTVHFKLQAADVEQNNVKGEKRFFIPLTAKAAWDEAAREVIIPFEYRPVTSQEGITYGTRNQQEKIIAESLEKLPTRLKKHTEAVAALIAERRKNAEGGSVSYLEHHLRQYTRRNTSDFFIHKNLRGFLERELDFYLKNEVLNLDEMLSGDGGTASRSLGEGCFQLMQVIRRIALRIIVFLAQIEDFQKALWEKKKFVLSTEYCMTLDRVPEAFYPEIAGNKAQIEEWRRLFKMEEIAPTLFHSGGKARKPKGRGRKAGLDVAFLKAHPSLVLDTHFFDQGFKDRLLATLDRLEEQIDGLLIHSENFQAMSLLRDKYRARVQCAYIDPPFNTENPQFLFKDDYKNASWLTLMADRLRIAPVFLADSGSIYVHVDHNSNQYARFLLDDVFGADSLINEVIWRIGWVSGYKTQADRYVRNHEMIFVYGRTTGFYFNKGAARIPCVSYARDTVERPLAQILKAWGLSGDQVARTKIGFRDWQDRIYKLAMTSGEGAYNVEDTWNCNEYEDIDSNKIKRNAAEYTPNGSLITQKPEKLLKRVIEVSSRPGDYVMDFFAGSGTTPAVAQKLGRKYVAVEMGTFFDTDIMYRMKQVLHGRKVGISRQTSYAGGGIFKYQRLESYEDALNNIAFDTAAGKKALELFGEDYLLRYMLDFETRDSETLLNAAKLESPFSYALSIHRDGQTSEQPVDLPETFNYLIGLHVKTRKAYNDGDRRYLVYRGSNERANVVVIWRATKGWEKADFERDKKFVLEQKLTEGADEIFVNGDSFIPDAKALDPLFKRLMLGGVV